MRSYSQTYTDDLSSTYGNRLSLLVVLSGVRQEDLVRFLDKIASTFCLSVRPITCIRVLNWVSPPFCSLGFAQADLVRLLDKNASTFRLSVGPVKGRVDFLLASGVDLEGLRTMVHKHPSVLRYRVDRVMQPRIDFLKVSYRY